MNDARKFRLGVATLNFEGESEESDTLGAVAKAARYPWRAGASKTIVLVICSECGQSDIPHSQIQELLYEQGITLHILREHNFEVLASDNNPTSSFLFGMYIFNLSVFYSITESKPIKEV